MSWVDTLAAVDGLQSEVKRLTAENERLEHTCITQSLELKSLRLQVAALQKRTRLGAE